MNNFWKNKYIRLLIIAGLLFVLFLALSLVKQKQEIRKRAEGTGEVKVGLSTSIDTTRVEKGSTFNINVVLTSPSGGQEINGATLKLSYNQDFFTINSANISCGSSFPQDPEKNVVDNKIYISCAVSGTDPYTMPINTSVVLATFGVFVKDTAEGQTTISFDRTFVALTGTSADVSDAGTTATYTIGAAATGTPTPLTITCDQTCNGTAGNCGYRNASGTCVQDNQCCHKKCVGNADCEIVWDDTEGVFEYNECDFDTLEHCSVICDNTCPGTCPAKMTMKWQHPEDGVVPRCIESNANPNCCAASTPTPTTPAGATGTPTPTTTVVPGNVKLQIKMNFSGVDGIPAIVANQTQKIRVLIRNKNNANKKQDLVNQDVIAKAGGVFEFSQPITLSSAITAGDGYYLLIKGPKHLQTRYCANENQNRACTNSSIALADGVNTLDFTKYPLPAGDLPIPQDGMITSKDATILIDCFKSTNPSSVNCISKADLNFDGTVSSFDQNIMNDAIFTRYEDEEEK